MIERLHSQILKRGFKASLHKPSLLRVLIKKFSKRLIEFVHSQISERNLIENLHKRSLFRVFINVFLERLERDSSFTDFQKRLDNESSLAEFLVSFH